MVLLHNVKQRILFHHYSKKKNMYHLLLAKEGHKASKFGVMKFICYYRETGTVAQAPGIGFKGDLQNAS